MCSSEDWESCSEEDDSDGEWVNVYHSSDEEEVTYLYVCQTSHKD